MNVVVAHRLVGTDGPGRSTQVQVDMYEWELSYIICLLRAEVTRAM
jgi:hypothetical protein